MTKTLSALVAALAALLTPLVSMGQLAAKPVVMIVPFAAGATWISSPASSPPP